MMKMETHELKLIYNGRGATDHKMPASLEKQITAGAQEFLGAHAFFYTVGRIPVNINDHSEHFRIYDLRQKDACWEAVYLIDVATQFFTEYGRELRSIFAKEAAIATNVGIVYLIHKSYRAWTERRPLSDRTFDWAETILSETSGNGAPIIDAEFERDQERKKLLARTNASLTKLTSPLGRAATTLDIKLDDARLAHFDRRIVSECEITQAVMAIRESRIHHRLI